MPPTLGDRLARIIEAIDNIQTFVASKDLMLRLAHERSFKIICEASRHVPPEIKASVVEIDWRHMTDLGNLLRHAYHRVDVARLMKIAGTDLPPLKRFVEKVLRDEKRS